MGAAVLGTVPAAPRAVDAPSSAAAPLPPRWRGVLRSTRVRVLVALVLLLALSAVVSMVAARQVLVLRLESRLDEAMSQEMDELARLLRDGRDPTTGQPFASVEAVFDVFFARNVPSAEEALLAFVDGDLHRAALDRFPGGEVPPEVMKAWSAASAGSKEDTASDRYETPLGQAWFRLDRIDHRDGQAAFVVTILPVAEMRELDGMLTWGLAAAGVVLLLVAGCAWPVAGQALAPVRELTLTARSISDSDLTRRISVSGSGESTEMATSFNAMLDRLEAVFRSQRQFVADASHELRDPLTIVRGHLELLEDEPVARQATVAMLLDEVERMSRIVADLQVLADVEQPDFLRPSLVDLKVFTRELLAKMSMLGQRQWEIDAAAGGFVVADRHRLTEVVTNLAHNAVQHTGPDGTIGIGTSMVDDHWLLWVRDTGVGVADQDAERIFERFTRGTGAHRRYQGAGLGLSIVAAVAQAHGGRVELRSRLGHGATFTLVLPTRSSAESG
jgi:two-component system, OmpR family, sensor kinase